MGLASAPEEAHRCKETSPLNFTINFPNVYLVSRRYIYTMLDSTVSSVIIQLEPHQLVFRLEMAGYKNGKETRGGIK